MRWIFAPGCALMLYKPELAGRTHAVLQHGLGKMPILDICCRNQPPLDPDDRVINTCPGCDRRFRENYPNAPTVSLWEILAEEDFFTFPDYRGRTMSIMDACPTRDQPRVQSAIRRLLERMNITLVEPTRTRELSVCCGDRFFGELPLEEVKRQMRRRADAMPAEDVAVYCVSCIKSVYTGGRTPRYLIDLLFEEPTLPKTSEPDAWHAELDEYIRQH